MRQDKYICCFLLLVITACTNDYGKTSTMPSSTETGENFIVTSTPSLNNSVTPTPTPSYALVDFNVNDIRIGAAEAEVLRKLGKPNKRSKVKVDNCGEETILRLNYPGLEIDLSPDETGINYVALSFLVTSSKWDIGKRVKLGAILSDIVDKYGKPWNESYNTTSESLGYSAGPGNDVGELLFKDGKLHSARWYVDPC